MSNVPKELRRLNNPSKAVPVRLVTDTEEELRRFSNPGEATKEIYTGFNDWSGTLASNSRQVAYALIAANWAVYGNADDILENTWARVSIAVVVVFLGINLICTGWMTRLYKLQCKYSDEDKLRWAQEYKVAEPGPSPWPYTNRIHALGGFMRILNIWAPVGAGVVFILGLILA